MAAKTTKTKKSKAISLAEFRAWLSGVEELQPADWAPNAEQWKLIRSKLNQIVDSSPSFQTESRPVAQQPPYGVPGQPRAVRLPSLPPPVPGGVPEGPVQIMPMTPDGRIKTPDLDTSKGGYGSNFT